VGGVIGLPHLSSAHSLENHYGFPSLEVIHNATTFKNLPQTPLQFMTASAMGIGFSLPADFGLQDWLSSFSR